MEILEKQNEANSPEMPWLKKTLYNEQRVVEALALNEAGQQIPTGKTIIKNEQVMTDFKTHVLQADRRPMDFQMIQIMGALDMLMTVCESQQKQIDSLTSKQ